MTSLLRPRRDPEEPPEYDEREEEDEDEDTREECGCSDPACPCTGKKVGLP